MVRLTRIDLARVDWDELDAYSDRLVFQTRAWIDFVSRTQRAEPVVAAVEDDGEKVGYFTGQAVRRYGIPILGSPLPGWSTGYMGFNLAADVSRRAAVGALLDFAFGSLRCLHVELKDRRLTRVDELAGLGLDATPTTTFELDLANDQEMFDRMTSACRRAIRKSVKDGVTVEQVHGAAFADEYYAQLLAVFARQSLRPTYSASRVRELILALEPTDNVLLLRARAKDGTPIASHISVAANDVAYFWGGASWREHLIHRPNEAIFWHAMRYWRDRGLRVFDLGGGGEYKRKFGPRELSIPFFRKSRFRGLELLRNEARRLARLRYRAGVGPPAVIETRVEASSVDQRS